MAADAQDDDAGLTIEQLAQRSGMTVRNIRNHQTRGLLPSPVVRARIGFYGDRHLERLRLIQELQAEGLKLNTIERLLAGGDDLADRLLQLRTAAARPFEPEPTEILTLAEIEHRFGAAGPALVPTLHRAQKLGLLVNLGDGTFEATSPALIRAAEDIVARGIPLPAALTAIERVHDDVRDASDAFVRLFLDELWQPFASAGRPAERWPDVVDSLEELPPLAVEVLDALFRQAMAEAMNEGFGKALLEQAKRSRRRG